MSFFYAIQLTPEVAPNRVKLGFTTNLKQRLRSHRCAAPTARFLAIWPCPRDGERDAILALTADGAAQRIGTEVYEFACVDEIVPHGSSYFGYPALSEAPAVPRLQQTTPFSLILRASGLTLAELHRRSGVSHNTLRSLANGRNERPQKRTRAKLAAAFREHSAELARLADEIDPTHP